jgi:hypothetical protein
MTVRSVSRTCVRLGLLKGASSTGSDSPSTCKKNAKYASEDTISRTVLETTQYNRVSQPYSLLETFWSSINLAEPLYLLFCFKS